MAKYGYARAHAIEQDLFIQRAKLRAEGCAVIREEKVDGTLRKGRDELKALINLIQCGDVLVVTKIDRLARSFAELAAIGREIEARGADIKAVDQPFDTTAENSPNLFALLGVLCDFENEARRERQLEMIAKARGPRSIKARQAAIDPEAVRRLAASGMGAPDIAKELKIGRAAVYRLMASFPVAAKHARIRDLSSN